MTKRLILNLHEIFCRGQKSKGEINYEETKFLYDIKIKA